MLGLGRVAGQTRPREPRRNLLPLLQMLMLLMSWATISQQGPRHLQEHEGPELLKNVHYEQQQRKKHRSTTARPPLPLLLRTDRAKQASARAAVFHWCCVETHWTEHGPRLVPCTAANWLKQMETAVPEAEQESKAGSNGPLQMKAGATCAKFCKGNSQESDCCTGRTGVWPMQGATARQASSDHRVPWTGSPECCPHTLAPWRARNLRAARFQHPRLGMRKAKPSRASPGSVQTEQADPTGRDLVQDSPSTAKKHYQAVIQMLPMAYRASKPQADFRFEAAALQSAVSQNSEAAQALQQAVATRLSALPPGAALCTEHDTVNTILLEETCRAFPPAQRADHRVSANQGYRASAGGTWQLHHQLRRSGMPSLRNIWARWRLYAQFMRASAMLRRQSKDLKRQFLEDQMRQAETTATSS
ncbi:hypothetical protein AK812_SmicGene17440 [Symbiodinium microadriaticum]|uniref:Uncharacterized protein n=1 Tax=Symbiodinium microadriaticum TaxID=2951 RepID=A0A1Q9DXT3_SYMMI|nr:hypothetical protein AK812_SmicGene17440 [Symbiodinium microadriaticum]